MKISKTTAGIIALSYVVIMTGTFIALDQLHILSSSTLSIVSIPCMIIGFLLLGFTYIKTNRD